MFQTSIKIRFSSQTFLILRKTFRNHIRTKLNLLERVKVKCAGLDQSVKVVHIAKACLLLLRAGKVVKEFIVSIIFTFSKLRSDSTVSQSRSDILSRITGSTSSGVVSLGEACNKVKSINITYLYLHIYIPEEYRLQGVRKLAVNAIVSG